MDRNKTAYGEMLYYTQVVIFAVAGFGTFKIFDWKFGAFIFMGKRR